MSNIKTIHIVLFGIGKVGSTLIHQINKVNNRLYKQNIRINIPVITNSRLAFFNDSEAANAWETDFKAFSVPFKIEDVIKHTSQKKYSNLIAVDATADEDFVKNYIPLIENGFHIVSANKIANSLHYDFYESLRFTLKKYNKFFLYETNVGAGLPIIETVKNLYNSGEQIEKIRGVFSGSLSYIFNAFSSHEDSFSNVLKQAAHLGLTEPDMREDLSGNDAARKLLILARELNLKVEFENVKVKSLVPKQLNGEATLHHFNTRVKELDEPFFKLKQNLPKNRVLRYVGELDVVKQTLEVKLISEEKDSAIGQLKDADTIFEIFTKSYGNKPIVIQGAGAGKEVTARGLFSDIVKLSNSLN